MSESEKKVSDAHEQLFIEPVVLGDGFRSQHVAEAKAWSSFKAAGAHLVEVLRKREASTCIGGGSLLIAGERWLFGFERNACGTRVDEVQS